MSPRVPSLCRSIAVGLAFVPGLLFGAATGTRSPFLPPQNTGPSAPTQGAPLEYRGYMVTNEGTQYRIYDPARKSGAWVRLNEKNADFDVVAKQHDESHKTLTIEHQGRTLTLAEREAKVVSAGSAQLPPPMPVQAPAPAAPATANVAPAVTQSVVLNPSPADEQRRLEAVAAEVARRRALREQASQQINQGTAPAVTVPQVAPQSGRNPSQGNFQQQPPPPGQRNTNNRQR